MDCPFKISFFSSMVWQEALWSLPSTRHVVLLLVPCLHPCSGPDKADKQIQLNAHVAGRRPAKSPALEPYTPRVLHIHHAFRKKASSLNSNLRQATPYLIPELQETGIHPACHSSGCSRTVPSRQADTRPSGQTARPVITAAARPPFSASPNRPLTARQRTGPSQQPVT